jgi:hypothetical protein
MPKATLCQGLLFPLHAAGRCAEAHSCTAAIAMHRGSGSQQGQQLQRHWHRSVRLQKMLLYHLRCPVRTVCWLTRQDCPTAAVAAAATAAVVILLWLMAGCMATMRMRICASKHQEQHADQHRISCPYHNCCSPGTLWFVNKDPNAILASSSMYGLNHVLFEQRCRRREQRGALTHPLGFRRLPHRGGAALPRW